ncbi:Plastid-lipid associated protein PAP / fibrillin family protein isoform 1 [Tripterygium wilfordii]|uniref:Plastid-lipid associated protein PAP / fibrillin family protein isoform 1 n=1 Tax=Tripterygium wilfordii TaxID=458696 RepID=A0A7J7CGZ4_TRIWF|nr:probable plastid-lipid-associated protein 4, chloroplastic [Tripterygium wilfordii]KAF5733306.1 Plastid-lipid associated protein PAP / fibrillin family protein isoform 1 [Tripterygium wilfordii]
MALSSCAPRIPASHSLSTESSSLPNLLLHSRSPPLTFNSFPAKPYNNDSSWYNLNNLTSDSGLEKWRASVSFFPAIFNNKAKNAKILKEELLKAIDPLDRGAEATPEDQQNVDQIASKLEAVTPIKEPLKSDLLNGKWELIYTTSTSILQKERPKFLRSVANYQAINTDTLRAQNMESWPFFNQVTADLTPLNPRKVAVKFDFFKIGGLIPVKAPERAQGELEITYLDEELRISRGDKGNLFILKMVDPSYRVPAKKD